MTRLGVCLACALAAAGCAHRWHLHVIPQCADGLPVQILTDARCPPDSICGYSCLPDRWHTTETPRRSCGR
jgi:hypothetical protein